MPLFTRGTFEKKTGSRYHFPIKMDASISMPATKSVFNGTCISIDVPHSQFEKFYSIVLGIFCTKV